tara:strand:+ start:1489 stop:2091 length:603 start_codon:yes stop_codon:yes gene_type:complete
MSKNDSKKEKDKEECLELRNINYQTMLLNNKSNIDSNKVCTNNIENFLNKEKELNKKKTWSKLSKADKLKKLTKFSIKYSEKNNLEDEETKILQNYFIEELGKKRLQKIKDVTYDIDSGEIKNIPKLVFLKDKKRFTIKRERKTNTLSSLPPKKTRKMKKIRNKKTKEELEKKVKKIKKDRKKIKSSEKKEKQKKKQIKN